MLIGMSGISLSGGKWYFSAITLTSDNDGKVEQKNNSNRIRRSINMFCN